LAEQVLHPERITGTDRIQALIGINRIAGTGLVLIDVLRNERADTALRQIKEFVGQWLGGFTVPFRTFSDIVGQWNKEARIARATREEPITGPLRAALPVVAERMKPAPRITRAEPYEREAPLLRQLTGLTKKTKTLLEREMDRLPVRRIWPKTGDARLDRLIVQGMGPIVERYLGKIIRSKKYQVASDEDKKDMLKDGFSIVKRIVTKQIHLPYIRSEFRKRKRLDRFKYFKGLIERRKLNEQEIVILMKEQSKNLTREQKIELLQVIKRQKTK